MKLSHCILFSLFFIPFASKGQMYSFSQHSETYSNLLNSTVVSGTTPWMYNDCTIPIGFDFQFFNSSIDTLYLMPDFYGIPVLASPCLQSGVFQLLLPLGAVTIDRGYGSNASLSPISYELIGETPNRILKIEWKNCGFFYDWEEEGNATDFINFQAWLFEKDGTIEFHYGPFIINQPHLAYNYESGPEICLIPAYYYEQDTISPLSIHLQGAASNPNMIMGNNIYLLEGSIPENKVFRFTNLTVDIKNTTSHPFVVYPNPFFENIYVKTSFTNQPCKAEIINLTGQVVYSENFDSGNSSMFTLSTNTLTADIYILRLTSNGFSAMKKIIKVNK